MAPQTSIEAAQAFVRNNPSLQPIQINNILSLAADITYTLTDVNGIKGHIVPADIPVHVLKDWIRGWNLGLLTLRQGINRTIMTLLSDALENEVRSHITSHFSIVRSPLMRPGKTVNPHASINKVPITLLCATDALRTAIQPCEACQHDTSEPLIDGCHYVTAADDSILLAGRCISCAIQNRACRRGRASSSPAIIFQPRSARLGATAPLEPDLRQIGRSFLVLRDMQNLSGTLYLPDPFHPGEDFLDRSALFRIGIPFSTYDHNDTHATRVEKVITIMQRTLTALQDYARECRDQENLGHVAGYTEYQAEIQHLSRLYPLIDTAPSVQSQAITATQQDTGVSTGENTGISVDEDVQSDIEQGLHPVDLNMNFGDLVEF